MAEYIDLHIHTDHSDGLQTPQEVIRESLRLKLKAISITDHDALTGYVAAVAAAVGSELEVVSGIELSAAKADDDIHIIGYLIDPANERLQESIKWFRSVRNKRGKKMVENLAAIGIKLDFEEILELAGKAAVGRPHLAELLLKYRYISSYSDAFREYLNPGGQVYVPKAKLTPAEAIELIHDAGGLAVMAHPGLTNRDDMIPELVAAGMDGIEIFHPTHNGSARKRYRNIGKKYGLFFSGGSDSHNRKGRYGDIGDQKVPPDYLDDIKAAWERRRESA